VRVLHVFNGDSAAGSFRQAQPNAELLVCRDAVSAGPAPAQFGQPWIDTRAKFLAEAYGADAAADLEATERALAGFRGYDEIVLWYGHDLFCLVVMLSHAARLATAELAGTRIAIVCPDGSAREPRFCCLGELPPAKLSALIEAKVVIDPAWIRAAAHAWAAYTAPDPTALNALPSHPLLRRALALHAARFPDKHTGLGRIEHQAVARLAEGDASFGELFRQHRAKLYDYDWGDLQFRDELNALLDRERPLIAEEQGRYSITENGRAALAGDTALGLAERGGRHLGGVALEPAHPWRYDAATARITHAA